MCWPCMWAMDDGTVGLKKSGAVGGAIDGKQQTGIATFTNFAPVDPHTHRQHNHYGRLVAYTVDVSWANSF